MGGGGGTVDASKPCVQRCQTRQSFVLVFVFAAAAGPVVHRNICEEKCGSVLVPTGASDRRPHCNGPVRVATGVDM